MGSRWAKWAQGGLIVGSKIEKWVQGGLKVGQGGLKVGSMWAQFGSQGGVRVVISGLNTSICFMFFVVFLFVL